MDERFVNRQASGDHGVFVGLELLIGFLEQSESFLHVSTLDLSARFSEHPGDVLVNIVQVISGGHDSHSLPAFCLALFQQIRRLLFTRFARTSVIGVRQATGRNRAGRVGAVPRSARASMLIVPRREALASKTIE
jgi:hypothetical protein